MTKRKRILSLALAVLMVLVLTPVGGELRPTAYAVTQDDIDSLKGDAKDLASQRSEVKSDLAELRSKRASIVEQKRLIDQQITLTEQEIENTESQIAGYEALLSQTAYELEENQKAEEAQYELFCRRARAMEEAGTASYWSVLFKAESFSDLQGDAGGKKGGPGRPAHGGGSADPGAEQRGSRVRGGPEGH